MSIMVFSFHVSAETGANSSNNLPELIDIIIYFFEYYKFFYIVKIRYFLLISIIYKDSYYTYYFISIKKPWKIQGLFYKHEKNYYCFVIRTVSVLPFL